MNRHVLVAAFVGALCGAVAGAGVVLLVGRAPAPPSMPTRDGAMHDARLDRLVDAVSQLVDVHRAPARVGEDPPRRVVDGATPTAAIELLERIVRALESSDGRGQVPSGRLEALAASMPESNRAAIDAARRAQREHKSSERQWVLRSFESVVRAFGRPDYILPKESGFRAIYWTIESVDGEQQQHAALAFEVVDGLVVHAEIRESDR